MKILILVIALASLSLQAPKPFPGPLSFKATFEIKNPPKPYSGDSEKYLYINFPFTTEKTTYKFRPHFGMKDIIHGNKAYHNPDKPLIQVNWGVSCTKENNCNYNLTTNSLYYYDGNTWNITDATTHFSLNGEGPDLTAAPMSSKLVFNPSKGDMWLFNNAGILGMSPTSSLWEYLFGQYIFKNDEINFTYWLDTNKKNTWTELFEESKEKIFEGSVLKFSDNANDFIEVKSEKTNFIPSLSSARGKNYWGINDVTVRIGDKTSKPIHENVEACISTMAEETIVSSHFGLAGEEVFKQLCDNPKGCDNNNNVENGPNILISFKDTQSKEVTITLKPEDYIYKGSQGDIGVSIGDMSEYETTDCPSGA